MGSWLASYRWISFKHTSSCVLETDWKQGIELGVGFEELNCRQTGLFAFWSLWTGEIEHRLIKMFYVDRVCCYLPWPIQKLHCCLVELCLCRVRLWWQSRVCCRTVLEKWFAKMERENSLNRVLLLVRSLVKYSLERFSNDCRKTKPK